MFFQSDDFDSDNPYEDLKRRRQNNDFVIVDHSSDVIADLLKVLRQGSQNDVTIICMDGEIFANKDILCLRSEYFRVMFSCNMKETMNRVVNMKHTTKRAMKIVIEYIFTGRLRTRWDESDEEIIQTFLEILNTSRIMMLDNLYTQLEAIITAMLPEKIKNLEDLVQGWILVEKYQLDAVREIFLRHVVIHLKQIIERRIEIFLDLPGRLIKEIILFEKIKTEEEQKWKAFEFWLSHNPQLKNEIMNEIIWTPNMKEEEVQSELSDSSDKGLWPSQGDDDSSICENILHKSS